jgi:hypothetical protein
MAADQLGEREQIASTNTARHACIALNVQIYFEITERDLEAPPRCLSLADPADVASKCDFDGWRVTTSPTSHLH